MFLHRGFFVIRILIQAPSGACADRIIMTGSLKKKLKINLV